MKCYIIDNTKPSGFEPTLYWMETDEFGNVVVAEVVAKYKTQIELFEDLKRVGLPPEPLFWDESDWPFIKGI